MTDTTTADNFQIAEDATTESTNEDLATATTVSASSPGPESRNDENVHANNSSILAHFKKFMHGTTVSGGKSVWATSIDTLGMADAGKWNKADRLAHTETEALTIIHEMIEHSKASCKSDEEKKKWDFCWTPLQEFDATLDDVLLSFCKWARMDNDGSKKSTITNSSEVKPSDVSTDGVIESSNSHSSKLTMNISKAFHRLETYAKWMYDNRELLKEPLTVDSITPCLKKFVMKLTHSKAGAIVWWCDFKDMDLESIRKKQVPPGDVVRLMVWASHLMLLDKKAQDNGMVIVEDIANISLWKFMTTFPADVATSMDRLTIGCLPIKMKVCYVLNAAAWMHIIMNMMKPFMSKKMRQRIVVLGKKQDAQEIIGEVLGGTEFILNKCCGLEGTMESDILSSTYIKE